MPVLRRGVFVCSALDYSGQNHHNGAKGGSEKTQIKSAELLTVLDSNDSKRGLALRIYI